MPIYEYTCPDCGKEFDELQKFTDPLITVCPTCKAGNVKKRVSATSFVLKGGGWYKDHYGLKGGGGSSSSDSGSGDGAASSPASSSSASASSVEGSSSSSSSSSSSTPATPSAPAASSSTSTS